MAEEGDNELTLKTGSHGVFHMVYTNDAVPPQPNKLYDYEIFMDFIDPKTRTILKHAKVGEGIEILDFDEGTYSVDAGDTTKWPLGKMPIDIKYVYQGRAMHTDTFYLNFIKGLSQ